MTRLSEYTTAKCSYDEAPDRLFAHFDGDQHVLPLRVKLGDLRLECDVDVHLTPKPGYSGYELLDIRWEPRGGGPYPPFSGTLSIADEGAGWCRVNLDGEYRPPFGLAGAAFDAAVGHRIAMATANDLLYEFKRILSA